MIRSDDEDGDDVALDEKARHAAGKQNPTEHQVIRKRHHQCSFRFWIASGLLASTTAPMIAMRIKTDVTSNGSRKS